MAGVGVEKKKLRSSKCPLEIDKASTSIKKKYLEFHNQRALAESVLSCICCACI